MTTLKWETLQRIHEAYNYIHSGYIDKLEKGHHDLSNGLYVNVMEYGTKREGLFEAHRKYIDLHYIILGQELIEICNIDNIQITEDYSDETDSLLGRGHGDQYGLYKGQSCLVLPEEAHMPGLYLNEECSVRKAVIKIPV